MGPSEADDLSGTYPLIRVNGELLPYILYTDPGAGLLKQEVTEGDLILRADGSFRLSTLRVDTHMDGSVSLGESITMGNYDRSGSSLTFRSAGTGKILATGTVGQETITCETPEARFEFAAAPGGVSVPLEIVVADPSGDHTGSIDVTEMVMSFDASTGEYEISIRASAEAPFIGDFRVNINLYNTTARTFFQDAVNDYSFETAREVISLRGQNPALWSWRPGDHVHTNSLAGTENPPNSSLYRSAVNDLPMGGFLENEDTIAFANLARPAIVRQP
jgi:hypothetical protein